jgi:thymidylate synthase (FAD)
MIEIISCDKNPLTYMGKCAAYCWGSKPSPSIAIDCINSDHGRVMEYPSVTVGITGYSAKCIRELYTHTVGVTKLQESTRYVTYDNLSTVIPPKVSDNKEALKLWNAHTEAIKVLYKELKNLGIPKEDASNVFPLAMETKVVIKFNVRALQHLAHVRLCKRAYHEIRKLVNELVSVLSGVDDEWKILATTYFVPKCIYAGYCNEKHSCGMKPKKEDVVQSVAIRCPHCNATLQSNGICSRTPMCKFVLNREERFFHE